jgi:adenylate cyclase class 2
MPAGIEREVKLKFDDVTSARSAILRADGVLLRARRLQRDWLLDTPDGLVRSRPGILRVRIEDNASTITFKGPVHGLTMKVREETEVAISDGAAMLELLGQLGFRPWFRYEKYREEFTAPAAAGVVIALDETPVGTFVELEGDARGIAQMAGAMGRGPGDYLLDSYRGLFVRYCQEQGRVEQDMLFATRTPC